MSAEIISHTDGVVIVKITGIFSYADQLALQNVYAESIPEQGQISILTIFEDFEGWSHDKEWADVSFQEQSDPYIKKMAIVGEEKWQDLALMSVGYGFRSFPIEYFKTEEMELANAWIMSE